MRQTLFFILLILLFSACRQPDSFPPPEFRAYGHNPILEAGAPGSWDDLFIIAPCIVLYDNVFYLFYLGCNLTGVTAVGLATSDDGVHFTKFEDNPVVFPDNSGFDAFGVGVVAVIRDDSVWVMYYNGCEIAGYGPGPSIGRATAPVLAGPWHRSETPVLETGRKGEWDDGFISKFSVLKREDESYVMYYTGGTEFAEAYYNHTGMATSKEQRWGSLEKKCKESRI